MLICNTNYIGSQRSFNSIKHIFSFELEVGRRVRSSRSKVEFK